MNIPKPIFLAALVILNAVPIYGVLHWNWHSFDLIFLYWLENLVIGLFVIGRFVIRRYQYPIEFVLPLFLAPFFAVHYGMFCYGHGSFIVSLFGKDALGPMAKLGIPDVVMPAIISHHLMVPVMALFIYQAMDWIRDIKNRGLGNDNVFMLMTSPYRRVVVLHITILASGFALAAMNDPVGGLILLVVIKTGNDIYHWFKDEKKASTVVTATAAGASAIDEKIRRRVDAFIDNPVVLKTNTTEIRYESFDQLKASKYYGVLKGVLRMAGAGKQIPAIEKYAEQRMNEKYGNQAVPAGSAN